MDMEHSHETNLFETLTLLESSAEAKNFLMDLCTPSEIRAFVERWKVCQLLDGANFSYREIQKMTGASLMTIGRVARFLNDESYGGYRKMLEKMKEINEINKMKEMGKNGKAEKTEKSACASNCCNAERVWYISSEEK
jgi:TrpR-related protein YerC/YecD